MGIKQKGFTIQKQHIMKEIQDGQLQQNGGLHTFFNHSRNKTNIVTAVTRKWRTTYFFNHDMVIKRRA